MHGNSGMDDWLMLDRCIYIYPGYMGQKPASEKLPELSQMRWDVYPVFRI
jgi:hypothetical protein